MKKLMLALLVLSGINSAHGMLRRVARTAGVLRTMRRVASKHNPFNAFSLRRKTSSVKKVSDCQMKGKCRKKDEAFKTIEKHFKKMNMHTDRLVWVDGKPCHIKQISNGTMQFDELPVNNNDSYNKPKTYFIEFLQQGKKLGINFHQNTDLLYLAARETDYLNTCDDCSDKQQSVGDFLLSVYLESEVGLEKKINQQNFNGDTVLHEFARSFKNSELSDGNYDELAKVLKCYGANPNIQNDNGNTPLHIAAAHGNILAIKLLISMGADVNILNGWERWWERPKCPGGPCIVGSPDRFSPFHLAIKKGNRAAVELFIEAGADIKAPSVTRTRSSSYLYYLTPVHVAVLAGHSHLISTLAEAGAQADESVNGYGTPLHCAIHRQDVKAVETLIKLGVDVNKKGSPYIFDFDTGPPLFSAVQTGNRDIVKQLCAAGADVHYEIDDYRSSRLLHYAVKKDDPGLVEELITAGADVNKANSYGNRPYVYIKYHTKTKNAKILEKLLKPKP